MYGQDREQKTPSLPRIKPGCSSRSIPCTELVVHPMVFLNSVPCVVVLCCISGYPLAVKLGTITKDGKADVFSYDEDDMVEDPNLIAHLAHFGINITQMEKVVTSHFVCLLLFAWFDFSEYW
jgi:hypothetical protein